MAWDVKVIEEYHGWFLCTVTTAT